MKSIIISLTLLISILQSCGQSNLTYELKKTKESFKREYIVSIHDHFPQKIFENQIVNASFWRPDSFSYYGCSILTLCLNDFEISKIKSRKFRFKLNANSDSIFFVTLGGVRDCENIDTSVNFEDMIPTANISEVNYQIGEISDSIYIEENNKYYSVSKYIVPDDMEIFITDFAFGNYWKSEKYYKKERCDKIGQMKNGYSYGYAISEKYQYVTYWAVAW